MSTASTNFTASGTQFSIPASTAEQTDITLFLIRALQALEDHTHASTRGAAVARVAATVAITASMTTTGDVLTLTNADPAALGVRMTTLHNSASPAVNDVLWRHVVQGKDSGGTTTNYGQLDCVVADATDGTEDAYWIFQTAQAGTVGNTFLISGGAAGLNNRIYVGGLQVDAGNVYVGDDANTLMTLGLTVNQGPADDEAFAIKSSDVAHGITATAETDTYYTIKKFAAATGGALVRGFAAGTSGLVLSGVHATDDTTHTAAGVGAVHLRASLKSGTGIAAAGADANLLVVQNQTTTRFIVDAEGNFFSDDVGTVYDAYDDMALVEAFDLRRDFAAWRDERRDALVGAGILAPDDALGNRGFVNWTNLMRLHNGALRQLHDRLAAQATEIAGLKTQLALGGA